MWRGAASKQVRQAVSGQWTLIRRRRLQTCQQLIHLTDGRRAAATVRRCSPENCSKTRLFIGHVGSPRLTWARQTNPAAHVIAVQSTLRRGGRKTLSEHARGHAQLPHRPPTSGVYNTCHLAVSTYIQQSFGCDRC